MKIMANEYFKLSKDPIMECVSEIRFETNYPEEIASALLYQKLKEAKQFSNYSFISQPIMQLPTDLRKFDPQLKYQPSYMVVSNQMSIGIGSNSILFSIKKPYKTFEWLEKQIIETLNLFEANFIKSLTRISLRYINKIEDSLFDSTELKFSYPSFENKNNIFSFRNEDKTSDDIISILQCKNNVKIFDDKDKIISENSSIVDIDAIYNFEGIDKLDIEIIKEKLSLLRIKTHDLFFKLFKTAYIKENFDENYKGL